ncbi:50S ribosomal protein L21 [Blattabacterium cuenoti]|uniref:50S ribosomal protein L21 n=1 Tax=Blattabacterium cuenoti TaxID=1653831 RepID=UPI00163B7373|nr:50S ribosomal protein L21 [Blattabacterium cuenoti]
MTYAIVNIQGKQFKLVENKYVYVPFLSSIKEGERRFLNQVLFFSKKGISVEIGTPFLENIKIEIEILQHVKGKKIIIFKKKRRKGYKIKNGFRPFFSKIKIISFILNNKINSN